MDIRRLVGRNVRRLRIAVQLTQEALSEKSGFDQRYISQLENGRRNPSLLALHEIAQALNVRPVDLLSEDEEADRQAE